MTPTATETVVPVRAYPLLAWGLLGLLALVWGSSFILIKQSLPVFRPDQVGAGRIAIAFLFFLPVQIAQLRKLDTLPLLRKHGLALTGSGFLGYALPGLLFAIAGAHLNSSLAGALNSLSPLFTLVLGALLFARPMVARQTAGILLGLVGSVLLVFFSASGHFSINGWALLLVGATFCYGLNINIVSRYLSHLPALFLTAWMFAVVGSLALAYLLTTDFLSRAMQPGAQRAVLAMLVLGGLGSGLMAVFFNRVVQLASPLFASSVTYLIPVVALGWGLFDAEIVSVYQYIGMGICLAGVYLTNRK
jgi:drug/metabolite transporter (DMT)-like permease